MPGRRRVAALLNASAVLAICALVMWPPAAAAAPPPVGFVPPLPAPLIVLRGFAPPPQPWMSGNRGVDLAANAGAPVLAAAAGVVLYAGELAGRGVISIQHGEVRTTYEPTDPVVRAGDVVAQGQLIGRVSSAADGCGPAGGCLHWGAIRGDTYVDPMSLLASAQPRAIRLLPIWGPEAAVGAGTAVVAAPPDTRPVPAATAATAAAATAATAATGTATSGTETSGTEATGAGAGAASPAARAARAVIVAGAVALTVTMGRVRRRSARRASRATAALPWYASGRSGFR